MRWMVRGLGVVPQFMLTGGMARGTDWSDRARVKAGRSDVDERRAGQGRVLLRASGTEPVVRVMVEAADEMLARSCAQHLAAALEVA